jgi:predicted DNA-binding transcriptional regulator AlpA
MTAIESIVTNLMIEIDRLVDQKVEEKLPEMIRALGIHEAEPSGSEQLIDALEVATRLGFDVSTENAIVLAKQRVYTLARQKLIPSVRLSPRRLRFDAAEIERVIQAGGLATAFTQAA